MKKLITYSLTSLFIFGLLLIFSCGPTDPTPAAEPSATEQVKTVLTSGAWKIQSVAVDGTDQTSVYKGLSLSFTNTSVNATNGGAVWPSSDTWKFTDETGKSITRGDVIQVSVDEATVSKLVLKLTWTKTTLGSGRINSVKGVNVFTFGK